MSVSQGGLIKHRNAPWEYPGQERARRGGALPSTRDGHQMAGRLPLTRFIWEFISLLGHHHSGNRVSGVKWGIVRMPHYCNRPKQNKIATNRTRPTPT